MFSSYIIKELKNLVLCRWGVIMHSGECWENTREACKTRGVAECFTSFSRILPTFPHRVLLHLNGTRLVFQFLNNLEREANIINYGGYKQPVRRLILWLTAQFSWNSEYKCIQHVTTIFKRFGRLVVSQTLNNTENTAKIEVFSSLIQYFSLNAIFVKFYYICKFNGHSLNLRALYKTSARFKFVDIKMLFLTHF